MNKTFLVLLTAIIIAAQCHAVYIDNGRQLFVDDYIISTTTLKRVWHKPVKYSGNPVLKPTTELEVNKGGNAAALPKGGGIWWDEDEKVFKLWYESGWLNAVTYATSKDGINWQRPLLDVVPGTNAVLPLDDPSLKPDSWCVIRDPAPRTKEEKYKMILRRPNCPPSGMQHGWALISADGIHWKKINPLPAVGDRSSLYYNPFRDTWVFSLRAYRKNGNEKEFSRSRCYYEQTDFYAPITWYLSNSLVGAQEWLHADDKDLPDARIPSQKHAQLYNFDAVAYESIMLGMAEIHIGPENDICEKVGMPKITDLKFAFSRNGKDFIRPERSAAIASERWDSGKWDAGYVQNVANLCVIMGDELWFYYGAFAGERRRANRDGKNFIWHKNNGMYANGAMGIAKMRRDGFVCLEGTGEVTTKNLDFSGEYLFVNVDATNGSIAAELTDEKGNVIEGFSAADSVVEKINSTKARIRWKTKDMIDITKPAFGDIPYRLRFKLNNAALYSFWISMTENGESNGYLAGGGPGYKGLIDKPKLDREKSAPKVFTPDKSHAIQTRKHEGIPSIAVSPGGRMWASWYCGKTPREDEFNYIVLTSSSDGGHTWKEFLIADPDAEGPRRAFDPELWISPDGKLRWFWTDRVGTVASPAWNDQLWMATLDAETGKILEPPRIVAKGVMMCKPSVLSNGTWILPVALWWGKPSSCLYASTDGGKTFTLRGGVTLPIQYRGFDEHNIVVRKDGTLVAYIRVFNFGHNCLMEAVSKDGGYTWSEPKFSNAVNLSSRSFVTKLKSGNWLMVKHGIYGKLEKERTNLTALLSTDEGKTWSGGLLIDGRAKVSYPDGQQLEDGSIIVVTDRDRTGEREISFLRFTEKDILSGTTKSTRTIISLGKENTKSK